MKLKKKISYEIRLKDGPRLAEAILIAKKAKEIARGFRNAYPEKIINIFRVTKEMIK